MATVTAENQNKSEHDIRALEEELKAREATEPENVKLPMLVEIEEFIEKNPLLSLVIAIGLGVTVGYLIRNIKNSESFQKRVMEMIDLLAKSGNMDFLSMFINEKK